jgi:hypothetical protein
MVCSHGIWLDMSSICSFYINIYRYQNKINIWNIQIKIKYQYLFCLLFHK